MKSYLFVLGRDPELSFLEILEYFKARNFHLEIELLNEQILIIKSYDLDTKDLIKHLGGTQKIGIVVEDLDKISIYDGKSNKIKFGISNYEGDTKDLQGYLKQRFKDEKLKAYQKKSKRKETFLSPSEAMRLDLEFLHYNGIIAKTEAVFNPKYHEKRDTQRPVVKPLEAVSIRLAKILVNLTGVKEKSTILDPFCGIGTVLQEGLLNNYNMVGIDINGRNIDAVKQNLKWLKKEYDYKTNYKAYKGDASKLSQYIKKVDAVASEPFMGEYLKHLPTKAEALKIRQPLIGLYDYMLKELNGNVKQRIVFVVPRWRVRDNKNSVRIDFEKLANKNKFKVIKKLYGVELPYVYVAGKSRLEREIWILEPNSRK